MPRSRPLNGSEGDEFVAGASRSRARPLSRGRARARAPSPRIKQGPELDSQRALCDWCRCSVVSSARMPNSRAPNGSEDSKFIAGGGSRFGRARARRLFPAARARARPSLPRAERGPELDSYKCPRSAVARTRSRPRFKRARAQPSSDQEHASIKHQLVRCCRKGQTA